MSIGTRGRSTPRPGRGQRSFPAENRSLRLQAILRFSFLVGRLLFGGFFLISGINHFKQAGQMSGYAASKRVPKPELAVRATGAVLIVGGASILLGFKPKLGGAAIVAFLAAVSPTMHDFWTATQPDERMNDSVNFLKNIALAGGAMAPMGWRNRGPRACQEKLEGLS